MNINKQLVRLKLKACELSKGGYFPPFLFSCICKLGIDTSVEKLNFYKCLSEKYIHVKGYYSRYPSELEKDTFSIKEVLKERGYI